MATALTADFDSSIQNIRATVAYTAATSTVIYAGGLVQLNSSGLAVAAAEGSTYNIVGRATTALDGTEAAGSIVTVEEGDIYLDSDPVGNGVKQQHVGSAVYVRSDHEVAVTAGSGAIVGYVTKLATGPYGASGAIVRCTLEATLP